MDQSMISRWVERKYKEMNIYERNVFGCFCDIHAYQHQSSVYKLREWCREFGSYIICKWQSCFKKDLYFKYIEIPITTFCSLNCKECNNLIQYYQDPRNYDAAQVIRDIKRICSVSKKIKLLRILGGEPLVHPDLSIILEGLKNIDKIEQIEVVTNGTLLFDKKSIKVLKSPRFSVDVSNYGEHSRKYTELIGQLNRKRIRYHTQQKQKPWKALGSCRCRERSSEELQAAFAACVQDCHSLLNGELHLCARSAHGTDLGVIEKRRDEFVHVRAARKKSRLKEEIYALLNRDRIIACDHCDMFQIDKIKTIPSAEQTSKKEAHDRMMKWRWRK